MKPRPSECVLAADAESLHKDFIVPTEESQTCAVLSGNPLQVAFGAFCLQVIIGLVDVIGLSHEAQYYKLLRFCIDHFTRINCAERFKVAYVNLVDGVHTAGKQDSGDY